MLGAVDLPYSSISKSLNPNLFFDRSVNVKIHIHTCKGRIPNVSPLIINILTPPNLLPRPSSLNAPPTSTPHHPAAFRTPSRVPPDRTPRRSVGPPSSTRTRTLSLVRIRTLFPRVHALAFRNLAHPPLLLMFLPVDHFLRLLPFLPEGRALSGYATWA